MKITNTQKLIQQVCNKKLMMNDGEKIVNETLCRSFVGSLLYLTTIRLNILYSISLLSRFMSSLNKIQLGIRKLVLRYIRGILNFRIRFGKNDEMKLIGFCDTDLGGCANNLESISVYILSLGSRVFSRSSKKKESIPQLSFEAKDMLVSLASSSIIWLKRISIDIGGKEK